MILLTVSLVLHVAYRNPWVHTKRTWQNSLDYTSKESFPALTTICVKCKLRPMHAHKQHPRLNLPQTPWTFESGLFRMAPQIALWMINEALLPIILHMAHVYPRLFLQIVDQTRLAPQN